MMTVRLKAEIKVDPTNASPWQLPRHIRKSHADSLSIVIAYCLTVIASNDPHAIVDTEISLPLEIWVLRGWVLTGVGPCKYSNILAHPSVRKPVSANSIWHGCFEMTKIFLRMWCYAPQWLVFRYRS